MNSSTVRKRGDTAPALVITCLDGTTPIDLTVADAVRVLGTKDGELVIDEVVTGSAQGVVEMALAPEHTASTGSVRVEVEVTWPNGSIQTFPASGYLTLSVVSDMG